MNSFLSARIPITLIHHRAWVHTMSSEHQRLNSPFITVIMMGALSCRWHLPTSFSVMSPFSCNLAVSFCCLCMVSLLCSIQKYFLFKSIICSSALIPSQVDTAGAKPLPDGKKIHTHLLKIKWSKRSFKSLNPLRWNSYTASKANMMCGGNSSKWGFWLIKIHSFLQIHWFTSPLILFWSIQFHLWLLLHK